MDAENTSNSSSSKKGNRTPEEQARIRSYVRLIVFVFIMVVVWYGFDLAHNL